MLLWLSFAWSASTGLDVGGGREELQERLRNNSTDMDWSSPLTHRASQARMPAVLQLRREMERAARVTLYNQEGDDRWDALPGGTWGEWEIPAQPALLSFIFMAEDTLNPHALRFVLDCYSAVHVRFMDWGHTAYQVDPWETGHRCFEQRECRSSHRWVVAQVSQLLFRHPAAGLQSFPALIEDHMSCSETLHKPTWSGWVSRLVAPGG